MKSLKIQKVPFECQLFIFGFAWSGTTDKELGVWLKKGVV